jgi:Ca-activated chloride channel homolog
LSVTRDGETQATVGYEAFDVKPNRDFDLYYGLSKDAIAVNLLSYKPFDEDGYFLAARDPARRGRACSCRQGCDPGARYVGQHGRREDGTGKGRGPLRAEPTQANDRFNIVAFSTATRLFADGPVSARDVAKGIAFVDKLAAAGSTDINRALLEALAGADPGRPTVLLFMTDGLPTAGETDPDRIVANVSAGAPKSVRLFSFGVGYDVDTVLLDELSSKHRGTSAYVRPEQDIKEEVSGFYAKVSAPVLVDVEATFGGVKVEDMYPYPLPDLFAGSQLVVAGRYRESGASDLRLAGQVNGQTRSNRYTGLQFVERGGNEFIARLWAQRKIGYLLTEIRLRGENPELVQEVADLGTKFGIATPYTSFLVEEPDLTVGRALPSPGTGGFGQGGGPPVGGAAAPPTAPPMLQDAGRSGVAAVEKAQSEAALQQSATVAENGASETVRQVGGKTLVLRDSAWVDTAYDAQKMKAEAIKFGSDRYFKLLTEQPEIGRYLALGNRVTVVLQGKAYAIEP